MKKIEAMADTPSVDDNRKKRGSPHACSTLLRAALDSWGFAMTQTKRENDREWASEQIAKYQDVFPRYAKLAVTLQRVLENATQQHAPLAIVQTRPKALASFAEKALRQKKAGRYNDPLNRMTDLCGGRVITQTHSDVKAMCEFIEKHFEIDWDNSVDVSQRLKPAEFGYRSVHYVVKFKRGVFPTKEIDVLLSEEVLPEKDCPMKAEIQVRTLLEHAWAGFTHDKAYKGAFAIPTKWQRELASLAARLEESDQAFSRIQAGLETYASSHGAYMTKDQMRDEIEILETISACDEHNSPVAHRIGKLAMSLGDWQQAIDIFTPHIKSGYQPILRDLGVALCKMHAKDPSGVRYQEGQRYLEAASAPQYRDADALASLAGTFKTTDPERARTLYRRAFEVDRSDPYAVSNYLVFEIAYRRDIAPVSLMAPAIAAAMQRCRDQIDVCMNLPWAYYNLGMFHLLLGQPYDSLAAYAKAIQLSHDAWMIETSLLLLDRLGVVRDALPGYEWMRRLLLIGHAVKVQKDVVISRVKSIASASSPPISGPVVIVSGGCDVSVEPQMQTYRELVLEAFRDFQGTIISGGTTAGISGLVGQVQQAYPDAIRTIGYVPRMIPAGVTIDNRYKEIRYTNGNGLSVLEPLQNWIDLLASDIKASQVRLLGITGGVISAAEYRIALALGARVAIVEGSGREAAKLFLDDDWGASKSLVRLPADAMTVRSFIGSGRSKLEPDTRETIAQFIHEAHQSLPSVRSRTADPSLADWDALLEYLKESNRQQADHISEKLRRIGCTMHPVKGHKPKLVTFTNSEVELMAEMEHGRWVAERLSDGWVWGKERDMIQKISPYLVPWSQLPEEARAWDRDAVRKIPELLAKVGLEIRREG